MLKTTAFHYEKECGNAYMSVPPEHTPDAHAVTIALVVEPPPQVVSVPVAPMVPAKQVFVPVVWVQPFPVGQPVQPVDPQEIAKVSHPDPIGAPIFAADDTAELLLSNCTQAV